MAVVLHNDCLLIHLFATAKCDLIKLINLVRAMQGLRPLQAHQDENSGLMARNTLSGKSFGGEEGRNGAMGPMKTPLGAGMPSARKALGNITNNGLHAANILPGKTAGAGTVARKPLGNVTNSKPAPAQAMTKAVSAAEDRLAKLAEGGVETAFGKGWGGLERDREDRIDDEISERLTAMASLGSRGLPTYYPHWVSLFVHLTTRNIARY